MIDLVQELMFETDNVERVEPMLRLAIDMLALRHLYRTPGERIHQYPSEATAYMMSFLGHSFDADLARYAAPADRATPFYGSICRLTARPNPAPFDVAVEGDLLAGAMEMIREADVVAFARETGEGPFARCDGSVRVGYRLHGGDGGLHVTLCHIYYSK